VRNCCRKAAMGTIFDQNNTEWGLVNKKDWSSTMCNRFRAQGRHLKQASVRKSPPEWAREFSWNSRGGEDDEETEEAEEEEEEEAEEGEEEEEEVEEEDEEHNGEASGKGSKAVDQGGKCITEGPAAECNTKGKLRQGGWTFHYDAEQELPYMKDGTADTGDNVRWLKFEEPASDAKPSELMRVVTAAGVVEFPPMTVKEYKDMKAVQSSTKGNDVG
jgi:hypothetical protein